MEKDERPDRFKAEDWHRKSNKAVYLLLLAVKPDKLVDCEILELLLD